MSLVQSKVGSGALTFDSTLTTGNVMVTVPFKYLYGGHGNPIHSTDARDGGTCPIDSHITKFGQGDTNFFGSSGINGVAMLGKIVTGDTYSGPFGNNAGCDGTSNIMAMLEFDGFSAGALSYEVLGPL